MFLFINEFKDGASVIKSILTFMWGILTSISDYVVTSLDFLYSFFVELPFQLFGYFGDLPYFMTIGFSSLFSVVLVVSVIKLISYLRG